MRHMMMSSGRLFRTGVLGAIVFFSVGFASHSPTAEIRTSHIGHLSQSLRALSMPSQAAPSPTSAIGSYAASASVMAPKLSACAKWRSRSAHRTSKTQWRNWLSDV